MLITHELNAKADVATLNEILPRIIFIDTVACHSFVCGNNFLDSSDLRNRNSLLLLT